MNLGGLSLRFGGLFIITLTAACSPQVGSDRWFQDTPGEQVNLHYSRICQNYGFKVGNQAFAECIQREINEQKQRNAIARNGGKQTSGAIFTGTRKSGVTIVLSETFD